MHQNGLNFVSFDDASIIASEKKRAIRVKEVKKIKAWLEEQGGDKQELFKIFLMSRLHLSKSNSDSVKLSLLKIFYDFLSYIPNEESQYLEWIEEQKQNIDEYVKKLIIDTSKAIKK